ncbi:MAG: transporter [Flavobacteriales bacterium]|nr:transporter [Flavobacteriales bacterium]
MKKISLLLALLFSTAAVAQQTTDISEFEITSEGLIGVALRMSPIATDRPDITESAQITPVGWLQYEGGYQFGHSEELMPGGAITDAHQIEEVLRFGINRRFEVRAVINANTERIDHPSTWNDPMRRTGVSPVTFGFKYNLIRESDVLPQTTWLSHISNSWISAGDYASVYPKQIFHEQRLMLEKTLTSRLGIASNIGVAGSLNGSEGLINEGMFSLALGYDLGNNYGVYVEYFSEWYFAGTQFSATPYFDGGFTRLLSNDLQLDIYAGFDLSQYTNSAKQTKRLFFGTGVSYRLPLAAHLKQ